METHGHCLYKLFKFLSLDFTSCKMGIVMLTSWAREGHFRVWNTKLNQVDSYSERPLKINKHVIFFYHFYDYVDFFFFF